MSVWSPKDFYQKEERSLREKMPVFYILIGILCVALLFFLLRGPKTVVVHETIQANQNSNSSASPNQTENLISENSRLQSEKRSLERENTTLKEREKESVSESPVTTNDSHNVGQNRNQQKTNGHRVKLVNNYTELVYVTILFKPGKIWRKAGWWLVKPGETVIPDILSIDEKVYIYGTTANRTREWPNTHDSKDGKVDVKIIPGSFDILNTETFGTLDYYWATHAHIGLGNNGYHTVIFQ